MQEHSGLITTGGHPMRIIKRLELPLTICLGQARLTLQEILALAPGSSMELDRNLADPVDIKIGGTLVATGELAMVNGSYAVRITRVVRDEGQE
jgi:flagellar motor switch protein FliN/FliY